MSTERPTPALLRTRWSAIGAAVAVSLGAGGIGLASAAIDSGDKPVTVTVDAKRILDTRTNIGLSGRFADATPRELQVTGDVAVAPSGTETVVPDGATAVLVNVTVVFPSDPGFLALRSGSATGEPSTSTVNFFPGSVEPNAATVDLSSDGKIQIWVETSSDTGNAHVLIDVVGYTIDHTHDDRYYTETEADAVHDTKANSADVYTKTESDDKYLSEIVLSHSTSELTPNGGGGASSVDSLGSGAIVSGNGTVNLSISGVAAFGGVEFGLKELSYCIRQISGGAFITEVELNPESETFPGDTSDPTDRTEAGCYTMTVNRSDGHAYDVQFILSGGGELRISGARTTWVPVTDLPISVTTASIEGNTDRNGS